jgi:hypothetical protein
MVVPSAVTAEYWYSIRGSQLSPLRTETDPSGWTWNSLPRLKNGMRARRLPLLAHAKIVASLTVADVTYSKPSDFEMNPDTRVIA